MAAEAGSGDRRHIETDGEGSMDHGNTAKPKVSSDSEAEMRAASSGSFGALHDDETRIRPWIISISKHSGVRRAGAPSRPRRQRHQDTEWFKLGMDSAREVLASRGVGRKTTRRRGSGTSRSDSENVGRRSRSRESQRRGRMSAEALSRQAR